MCTVDPEKYDQYQIPFGYALVDCKDFRKHYTRSFGKGSVFFSQTPHFLVIKMVKKRFKGKRKRFWDI